MNLDIPDILFSIILLLFTINGFRKGFIKEIARLTGLFFACIIASRYHIELIPFIEKYFINEKVVYIIAFLIIFFVALIIINILSSLIQKFFEIIYLGWLNKLLGSLLGFIKGLIIISIIIFCLGAIPFDKKTINRINDDSNIYRMGNRIKKYLLKNATNEQNMINNFKKEVIKLINKPSDLNSSK